MTLNEWLMYKKRPDKPFWASLSYAISNIQEYPCKLWMRHSMDTDQSGIYYVVENAEDAAGFLKNLHPTKNKYTVEEKPADLTG